LFGQIFDRFNKRLCWASSSRITASVFVVEGGEDLVGVLFRVVKSQAADREIDDFMTVPRSRPG
jgi:hypothetical protein